MSNAPKSFFSIRILLTAAIGILSILSIGLAGQRGLESLSIYRSSVEITEFNAGANFFVKGLFAVLLERVTTNTALQASDPASNETIQSIESWQKIVTENYQKGLDILSTKSFPDKANILSNLSVAMKKAAQVRSEAMQSIRLPKDRRDETLRKTYVPTISDWVSTSLALWYSALYQSAENDPVLMRFASIKEIGWRLRDVAGFERQAVASAIASDTPASPDANIEIKSSRRTIDVLWGELGNLTKTPDTSPAILKAMEQAKSQYFADFRNLSDEVRRTKEGGAPYPMNGSKWIATTTPQIGSLLDVMYAANDASEAYMSELKMTAYERLITVSVILCSILIFGLLCIYYVIGRVTAPLSALSVAIGRLADGQLNTSIPGAHRRDELGDVARTVKVFKDGLMEVERLRQQNEQEQKLKDQQGLERERERAQRDLEQRQKVARAEEINKIIQQFEAEMRDTIAELTKSAASLDKTATDLAGATNQSTQKAQSVAEDSTSASSNVQLVASATHQLSASIREISDQVGGSTRIVGEAVREAEVADTAVQGLSEAASRIGSILELISSIASKTDLLALNATIEAARAGDAGKGFAVVASEVKNLATQTARATEDISRQISDMQSATTSSVTAIKHITKIITEIDQISSSISSAVEEQAAATSDIARNVEQASVGTANVSRNIAGVQNAAVVTADIVSHVRSASKGLFDGTTKVDQMVKNFLNEVRQS